MIIMVIYTVTRQEHMAIDFFMTADTLGAEIYEKEYKDISHNACYENWIRCKAVFYVNTFTPLPPHPLPHLPLAPSLEDMISFKLFRRCKSRI